MQAWFFTKTNFLRMSVMGIASNGEALFSCIVVIKEFSMSTSLYMARVGRHGGPACCSSDWDG